MSKLGVIILNYNNITDTVNCIGSVIGHSRTTEIKFVVVDNASRKEVVQAVGAHLKLHFPSFATYDKASLPTANINLPQMNYLCLPKNIGYASGNNAGLELLFRDTTVTHVMILNNDILFTGDIIPELMKAVDELPDAALVSPLLYKRNGISIDYNCARKNHSLLELCTVFSLGPGRSINRRKREERYLLKQQPELIHQPAIEIELPSGSCMLMQTATAMRIGGFDPYTFLYYEENILYKKIATIGLKNYLIPSLSCIHLGGETTKQSHSTFITRCNLASITYYMQYYAHYPWITTQYVRIRGLLFLGLQSLKHAIKQ